jgi:hypothetical protein
MQILDAYEMLSVFANNAGRSAPLEPRFTTKTPVARIAKRFDIAFTRRELSTARSDRDRQRAQTGDRVVDLGEIERPLAIAGDAVRAG